MRSFSPGTVATITLWYTQTDPPGGSTGLGAEFDNYDCVVAFAADMTPERNALMEQAYPRLKEYCRTKYRFEFQVTLQSAICVLAVVSR